MTQMHKAIVQQRLKELNMTQARLAEELGTTPAILSRTLGSDLVRPDSHWPAVLKKLGLRLTLEPIGQDEQPLTAAGVPYTGDYETDAVLNDFPDILERVARFQSGKGKMIPIEEVAARLGLKL